jgi:hypothetical protein
MTVRSVRLQPDLRFWPCFIPLLALLYAPFIGGDLLTDDFVHFERLRSVSTIADVIAQPDAFRFYRPVTQASLAIELAVHGDRPPLFRAVNIALHAAVLALALVVARLILVDSLSAALAALAFALTPKAPVIAVLWISGRAELLMSLFSLLAIAAWIVWTRKGGTRWLVASAVAYILAAASKETGFLLPLLWTLTPGQQRSRATTLGAVVLIALLGASLFAWRSYVGALMPLSGDEHYSLLTGIARVARSVQNYSGRMIGAPLALVVLLILARIVDVRRAGGGEALVSTLISTMAIAFPLAWMLIFLAPVLPIVARSELYLYLPVFGMCLLAGALGGSTLFGAARHRAAAIALVVFVIAIGVYQVSRAAVMHGDLEFSARLVHAIRADTDLASRDGAITLVPADAETQRHLRDAIGGYLYAVLRRAFPDGHVTGDVQYERAAAGPSTVYCSYRGDVVLFTPAIQP